MQRLGLRAGRTVLDVGAGTGKLTRALVPSGARVIAVEPIASMRAALMRRCPTVTLLDGTAESLPIEDAGVDAIVCAQAFHWFAEEQTLREFHRVLRPEGHLALVWNRRRLDQPLHAAIRQIIEPHRAGAPTHESEQWREVFQRTALFECQEERRVTFEHLVDSAQLVDRVASISFVAALDEADRAALLARVRALVPPDAGAVELGYVCEGYLYTPM